MSGSTDTDTGCVGSPMDNCRMAFEKAWPQYKRDDKAWFCFSSGWSNCLIFLMETKEAKNGNG